jgi:hypothetical protein
MLARQTIGFETAGALFPLAQRMIEIVATRSPDLERLAQPTSTRRRRDPRQDMGIESARILPARTTSRGFG